MLCKRTQIVIFSIVLLVNAGEAGNNRTGQAGMTFLDIDLGARPAGMGGVFAAGAGDAIALFWNPAGIAVVEGLDLVWNQSNWLAGMNILSAGLVYATPNYGSFGISLLNIDNPDVRVTSISSDGGVKTDHGFQDIITQFAVGLAYARRVSNIFSVGGQLKWVHEDFGRFDFQDGLTGDLHSGWEASGNLLAFDFGTQYKSPYKGISISLALRNFAQRTRYQLEYFEIPVTFRFGVGVNLMEIILSEVSNQALMLNVEAVSPRDYSERLQAGLEYWRGDLVALRAGYKFHNDLASYSLGFGLKHSLAGAEVRFDYAYSEVGHIFDALHYFTIGLGY